MIFSNLWSIKEFKKLDLLCSLGMQEEDGPEAALAKLLAGAVGEQNPYAGLTLTNLPLRGVPSEQQLQVSSPLVYLCYIYTLLFCPQF